MANELDASPPRRPVTASCLCGTIAWQATGALPGARYFTTVFCTECGSRMPRLDEARGIAIVPMGSLDDDPDARSERHIFVGSRAPWDVITDDRGRRPHRVARRAAGSRSRARLSRGGFHVGAARQARPEPEPYFPRRPVRACTARHGIRRYRLRRHLRQGRLLPDGSAAGCHPSAPRATSDRATSRSPRTNWPRPGAVLPEIASTPPARRRRRPTTSPDLSQLERTSRAAQRRRWRRPPGS